MLRGSTANVRQVARLYWLDLARAHPTSKCSSIKLLQQWSNEYMCILSNKFGVRCKVVLGWQTKALLIPLSWIHSFSWVTRVMKRALMMRLLPRIKRLTALSIQFCRYVWRRYFELWKSSNRLWNGRLLKNTRMRYLTHIPLMRCH